MFWIQQGWWHTSGSALAEQCLHSPKVFSFPTVLPQRGVGKGLGGCTTQTASPGWPEGYSTLYNIMLSNKNWGEEVLGWGSYCLETCLGCWWEVLSDCFSITCFVFSSSSLHLLKCISIHYFPCLCSLCSLPLSRWGLGREGAAVWSLAAAQGQPTTPAEQHLPGDQLLRWVILEYKKISHKCLMSLV